VPERRPRRTSALSVLALLLAVAALALAGWALHRPAVSEPSYSDARRAGAKAEVCSAVDVVRKGVSLNTNLQPAGGPDDITGSLAVTANARVALYDGGQYLLAKLDPATPPDLADEVRKFANGLLDIGAAATAGIQNADPVQAGRLREAETASANIGSLCK
jgi:hypothetical protein